MTRTRKYTGLRRWGSGVLTAALAGAVLAATPQVGLAAPTPAKPAVAAPESEPLARWCKVGHEHTPYHANPGGRILGYLKEGSQFRVLKWEENGGYTWAVGYRDGHPTERVSVRSGYLDC